MFLCSHIWQGPNPEFFYLAKSKKIFSNWRSDRLGKNKYFQSPKLCKTLLCILLRMMSITFDLMPREPEVFEKEWRKISISHSYCLKLFGPILFFLPIFVFEKEKHWEREKQTLQLHLTQTVCVVRGVFFFVCLLGFCFFFRTSSCRFGYNGFVPL